MVDKIKSTFIELVLPTQLVFKHLKHAAHNILRLAWGPYARSPPGNWPARPFAKTALRICKVVLGHVRFCHHVACR